MASHKAFFFQRPPLGRVIVCFLAVLAVVLASAIPAQAASVPRAYAGIVVDAKTGDVLYSSDADEYRYPASVTKVMTLYVLFQELAAGNIKLTDQMTVSKHAAAAVPTKLGLKAGSKISVENAIKALVTLSANDMARVIAEHISGTESEFAARMTATAKALGMSKTKYANASGLPDTRQITTVRDQARLGMAIYEHFPKYYAYFQTKSFKYGRRTYGNHNNLLGSNGVDGIKTGYTQASGYNLLTASRTDGHHIVVVGFGFNTGASRDAKVRELVKKYLPKSRSGGYLEAALIPKPGGAGGVSGTGSVHVAVVQVFPAPLPSFRLAAYADAAQPEIGIGDIAPDLAPVPVARPGETQALVAAETLAEPEGRPLVTDVIGAWLSEGYSLGAPPAELGATAPSAPLLPPVGVGSDGEPIDLMTSGSIESSAPVQVASVPSQQVLPQALPSGWIVQIGAAPTQSGADTLLGSASAKVSQLSGFRPFVERFEKAGQVYFRARFSGFADQADANAMCTELKKANMSCLAMQG